ncbi:MAG: glycosyltransferase [Clostridium sp.]
MVVVIPAYEPDNKLINLVSLLKKQPDCKVLIVNDGSGKDYQNIFDISSNLGAQVLSYEKNKGKGYALKTAFSFLKKNCNDETIVTADCDGQHLPKDILKISQCAEKNKDKLILGTRHFSKDIPLRSSLGNKITSAVFQSINGIKIYDTQTGLRGFSKNMLDWLCGLDGNRYEYEMNMLLEAERNGYEIKEVPIETVYIDNNASSHFNPILDSLKIYFPILKFSMSSIISGALDFILLFVFKLITNNLFISVITSRFLSASTNYIINKKHVFKADQTSCTISLFKYIFLAVIVLSLNYIMIDYLCNIGLNLLPAKIITEGVLFIFSFTAQKKFVFK